MSRPKKHHVVPQCYLRRFTRRADRLFVFDKPSSRVYSSHIRDVAHENGFHDLSDPSMPGVDATRIEADLSRIEGMFAQTSETAIREIKWLRRLDTRHQVPLAAFMALQLVRTVDTRASFGHVSKMLAEELNRRFGTTQEEFEKIAGPVNVTKEQERLIHINYMLNPNVLKEHAKALYNHIWVVGENNTGHALYTSDAPVVRHAHRSHPFMGMTGLSSEGIEVAFPLSSRLVLILVDRNAFQHYSRREGGVLELEAPHVQFYNSLQVIYSRRQVFCTYDDFSQAKMMVDRDPNLRDIDRPRLEIVR